MGRKRLTAADLVAQLKREGGLTTAMKEAAREATLSFLKGVKTQVENLVTAEIERGIGAIKKSAASMQTDVSKLTRVAAKGQLAAGKELIQIADEQRLKAVQALIANELTTEVVLDGLKVLARSEKEDVRLRAYELLGRYLAMFTDRTQTENLTELSINQDKADVDRLRRGVPLALPPSGN